MLDQENKLGWLAGVYIQDEWRITRDLTLNAGLRFDQMWQYVDANQLSPRLAAVYKPFDGPCCMRDMRAISRRRRKPWVPRRITRSIMARWPQPR